MNLPSGSAILNDLRPLPGGKSINYEASVDMVMRFLLPPPGLETPELQFYVRKNRLGPGMQLQPPVKNMLSAHGPGEFDVICAEPPAPCDYAKATWRAMGSGWSQDAAPGDWVRRHWGGSMVEPRPPIGNGPCGMVVGVISRHQTDDPKRFLILWFR